MFTIFLSQPGAWDVLWKRRSHRTRGHIIFCWQKDDSFICTNIPWFFWYGQLSFRIKKKIHTKVVLDVPMWGDWKFFCLGKQINSFEGGVCLGLEVRGNMRKVKWGERVRKWIFIQRQGKLEKETCLLHTWIAGWRSVVIVV